MAVLAPKDWQPPRQPTPIMDGPSSSSTTTTTTTSPPPPSSSSPGPQIPRARSSPANEPAPSPPQGSPHAGQPYPYAGGGGGGGPGQGWTPSPTAQPFYPQYFQGAPPPPPPQGYGMQHPGAPMPGMAPPGAYYDPAGANAQFAQWAYHQMMINQAHQLQQGFPPQMVRVLPTTFV